MSFVRSWMCLCLLPLAMPAAAQGKPAPPERFPYVFSNFVWWSDAGLRQELTRHKLPAEVARNSSEERAVRKRLEKLLHKQGVHAKVQSFDPPQGAVPGTGSPPPAVVFRVLAPPEIDVESVTPAPGLPATVTAEAEDLNHLMAAHAYTAEAFPWRERRVERALAEHGYLTAKVTLAPGPLHSAADGKVLVPLTVTAQPGPQFHVGEVTADGGPLLAGRDLRRYIAIRSGDLATPQGFTRLEASLRVLYQQKGYADVTFASEPTLDPARKLANYHFRVVPGTQYTVGRVEIHGLSPAQSGEARAALGLKPGAPFNERALGELYRKIKSSPTLVHETFSYTVRRDQAKGTVELTLDFSHEN